MAVKVEQTTNNDSSAESETPPSVSENASAMNSIKIELIVPKKEEPDDAKLKIIEKKKSRGKGGKKKPENKKKILAYLFQVHETLGKDTATPKKDIAEAIGYSSHGCHGFFYSYKELVEEGMIAGGKLTDLGFRSLPKDSFSFAAPKTNEEKQEQFYKLLRKKCKEGTDEKTKIIFDILSDGKPHDLKEFTRATGYANLKSKGLGYNFTCMLKDMKILEKTEQNKWRFSDKCFPKGRPN